MQDLIPIPPSPTLSSSSCRINICRKACIWHHLYKKHFRNTCRRVDRGVHQAGFLVLKASAMPSILVELGFISTPEEERYLNTDAGTGTLADGIFRAFLYL